MLSTKSSCHAAVLCNGSMFYHCLMIRLQSHAVRAFALLDAFTVDLPPDRTLTNEQTFWYPEYVQHSVAESICALLI